MTKAALAAERARVEVDKDAAVKNEEYAAAADLKQNKNVLEGTPQAAALAAQAHPALVE